MGADSLSKPIHGAPSRWRAAGDRVYALAMGKIEGTDTDRLRVRGAAEVLAQVGLCFIALWPLWWWIDAQLLGVTAPMVALILGCFLLLRSHGPIVGLRAGSGVVGLHWLVIALSTGGSASPALVLVGIGAALPALLRDVVGTVSNAGVTLLAVLAVLAAEYLGWWTPPLVGGPRVVLLVGTVGMSAGVLVLLATQLAGAAHRSQAELEKANLALATARDAAAASSEAKSAFLAAMSHEIRTPMNGILGVAGMLLESELDRRQRDFVETIRDSSNALVDLVEDILDFSRIEAGRMRIEASPFEPVAIVRQVADLLRVRAREKGLRLEVEIGNRVPGRVIGDGGRLRQILFNLVGNAVKFTHAGHITVRVQCHERTPRDAVLRVEVEDTGIGIPRDDLGRIFDRFTQLGGNASDRAAGTGLGLSITKHVVDLMDGTISVESEVGAGTRFRVDLRLPVETTIASIDEDIPGLPAARILLAEDNPVNRKVALAMLDHLGCLGDTADNGELAVRLALAHAYDLILMDLEMPIMDGVEATRRLRAAGYTGPIVAMTAHVLPEVRRRCEDAGMNDFLEKPVRVQSIHRVLARWLVG